MSTRLKLFNTAEAQDDECWSLPPLGHLLLFGLVVPAAAAFSNQWILEHLKNSQRLSIVLYPWMALCAAVVSWSAGRYLYPTFLRCAVFAWCLVLLDLLTFMASLGSTHDSMFGYMLVSAQINLLILWTVLGAGGWQWRLPVMLVVVPLVILLSTSIGSTWWLAGGYGIGGWFSQSWQRVVLLAAIVAAMLCAILRWLGFSLRTNVEDATDTNSEPLRISQFGVKHMLIWATAIVPLLLIARSLDFLLIAKFKQNEIFPFALLAVGLATVSLVAIWVVLGAGAWYVRLPFLLIAPLITAASLEGYSMSFQGRFTNVYNTGRPIFGLFMEMSGSWFAWIWQGTALLAALLLFLRASGYRCVRSERKPNAPA